MSTKNLAGEGGGVKGGWRLRLTTSPPSVCQFVRKYESIDVSQPYESPRPLGDSLSFTIFTYIPYDLCPLFNEFYMPINMNNIQE
jgi:hypothetical protein